MIPPEEILSRKIAFYNGRRTITERTVKTQLSKFKKIVNNLDDVKNHDTILQNIDNYYNTPESRLSGLQAVASILQILPEYNDDYKFYSNLVSVRREALQKITDKQLIKPNEKIPKWEDVKTAPVKMKDLKDKMITAFYTMLPPRRVEDVSLIKIGKHNDPEYNYITDTYILYRKYKGSGSPNSEPVRINLPTRLKTIYKNYKIRYNLKNGDLLFGTDKHGIVDTIFGIRVRDTFRSAGIDTTVTSLRKSFISWFLNSDPSLEAKKEISRKMGHSFIQQQNYRRRDVN